MADAMADPIVRRAESDDAPEIADLYLEIAAEVIAREPSLRHVSAVEGIAQRYQSRIADRNRGVFVALTDGAVVGFSDTVLHLHEDEATYHLPGVDGYVEELVVTAAYRRRGFASALIRAAAA